MTLLLAVLLAADVTAEKIAATQREQPWFWSPPQEGLAEIPYTYEARVVRRLLDARGGERKGKLPYRELRLEHTVVDGYTRPRCVTQDGQPCAGWLARALAADVERKDGFTAAEAARVQAIQQQRRAYRSEFWANFASVFRFEPAAPVAPGRLRFGGPWRGTLRYDPDTYRLLAIEYEVVEANASGPPLTALPRGTSFAVELAAQPDGQWLPVRIVQRKPEEGGFSETVTYFSHYRRFAAHSQIRFDK